MASALWTRSSCIKQMSKKIFSTRQNIATNSSVSNPSNWQKTAKSSMYNHITNNYDISQRQLRNSSIRFMASANDVHITLETAKSNNNKSVPSATEDKTSGSSCSQGIPLDNDEEEEEEQEEMFVIADPELGLGTIKEWGGPRRGGTLPEPTRFGDWERKGRCTDF